MSELLRHIDAGSQDEDGERDAWDPGYEADDGENGEEEEDDSTGIIFARQHVDGRYETEDDVENSSDPDELLCKLPCKPYVDITEDNRNQEHESKQHDGICREAKVVLGTIDTSAIERES